MEKVSLNKGLLIGLIAVAAVSLLAVAFLLGRTSGSGLPSGQPSAVALPASGAASLASNQRSLDQPAPLPNSLPAPEAAAADATGTTSDPLPSFPAPGTAQPPSQQDVRAQRPAGPATAQAGERGNSGSETERAGVAKYLDAVERIQPGKMSGSAESLANDMAVALANGDTSGLDKMIRETQTAKERLASLIPPSTCTSHHQESLASLDDALAVLNSLKAAMGSPEPAAQLANVANRANALRSRAEALQKEEQALRQRTGLTR